MKSQSELIREIKVEAIKLLTNARTSAMVYKDVEGLLILCSQLQEQEEWRKIEEAPKDKDLEIQLYCKDTGEQFVGYYDEDGDGTYIIAHSRYGSPIACRPTHWRPLPTPPAEGEG